MLADGEDTDKGTNKLTKLSDDNCVNHQWEKIALR